MVRRYDCDHESWLLMFSGDKLIIELKMNDTNLPSVTSRNAVGEILGYEKPDEVVIVSGHIDR